MSNHQSLFDLFVIPAALPGVYTAVEAAYHFSIPLWGSLITRWGCIPIHRRNLEKAKESLDIARKRLWEGLSLIILPEGHRTRTGRIGDFKKGPFYLARQAGEKYLPHPDSFMILRLRWLFHLLTRHLRRARKKVDITG